MAIKEGSVKWPASARRASAGCTRREKRVARKFTVFREETVHFCRPWRRLGRLAQGCATTRSFAVRRRRSSITRHGSPCRRAREGASLGSSRTRSFRDLSRLRPACCPRAWNSQCAQVARERSEKKSSPSELRSARRHRAGATRRRAASREGSAVDPAAAARWPMNAPEIPPSATAPRDPSRVRRFLPQRRRATRPAQQFRRRGTRFANTYEFRIERPCPCTPS